MCIRPRFYCNARVKLSTLAEALERTASFTLL